MAQLLIPTCSASPANGGTLTATATTSGTFSSSQGEWRNYRYLAIPAAGFTLDRIEITSNCTATPDSGSPTDYWTKATIYDGHSEVEWSTSPEHDTYNVGFGYDATLGGFVWESLASSSVYDRRGSAWWDYYNTITTTQTSLVAVAFFKRVPTHLLVNSATLGSPVRLVHDPDTHLLVADY